MKGLINKDGFSAETNSQAQIVNRIVGEGIGS